MSFLVFWILGNDSVIATKTLQWTDFHGEFRTCHPVLIASELLVLMRLTTPSETEFTCELSYFLELRSDLSLTLPLTWVKEPGKRCGGGHAEPGIPFQSPCSQPDFFFFFGLLILFITFKERGMLKSSIMITNLSISPF